MSLLGKIGRRLSESSSSRRGSLQGGMAGSPGNVFFPSLLQTSTELGASNESNVSNSGKWDHVPIVEQEKTDPSKYLWLIRTDPLLDWEEAKNLPVNILDPHDGMSIEFKVFQNKTRDNASIGRILSKFADETVDDYLFEVGILKETLPKFDDYINEIEALRECRHHKNIIDFYDSYYFDSKLWVFTEYCTYGTIEKLINDLGKPLSQMQIHYILKETLYGLEYLHERAKICHRDLKGANLFIGDDFTIKIANFTLSAKVNSSQKKKVIAPKAPHYIALEVLKTGYYFVRSPHYMAPEVVRSYLNQYDNPKSDVWSLGITCLEMAEVYPPMKLLNPEFVIQEINNESFKPTLKEPEKWDPSFVNFVNLCLVRNFEMRAKSKELLEHEFIVKNKFGSSKNDIQKALADRKLALHTGTKEKVQDLDASIDDLKLINELPEVYLKNYFDDLKKAVDAKAQEALEKIDFDHKGMVDSLQHYYNFCLDNLKTENNLKKTNVEGIVNKFNKEQSEWNKILSKEEIDELELNQTKVKTSDMAKFVHNELNKSKLILFSNKVYELNPVATNNIRFGELHEYHSNDLLDEDSEFNHLHGESSRRPINKLIRFDIKGSKRK